MCQHCRGFLGNRFGDQSLKRDPDRESTVLSKTVQCGADTPHSKAVWRRQCTSSSVTHSTAVLALRARLAHSPVSGWFYEPTDGSQSETAWRVPNDGTLQTACCSIEETAIDVVQPTIQSRTTALFHAQTLVTVSPAPLSSASPNDWKNQSVAPLPWTESAAPESFCTVVLFSLYIPPAPTPTSRILLIRVA